MLNHVNEQRKKSEFKYHKYWNVCDVHYNSENFSLDISAALGSRNTNCDKKGTKLMSMYK